MMSPERTRAQLLAEIDDLRERLARHEAAADEAPLPRLALLSVLEDEQRANRDIRKIQARLDGILASIDQAVWSIDIATEEVLYLNPAAETIYGRPVQAFFDTWGLWLEVVLPDDRPLVAALVSRAIERGAAEASYRILRPDGEVRWVRDRASLVRDPDGTPARLDGVVSDITESRRAEQAILESEQQFRGLVEQSIAGLFIVQDGKIAYVNPRFAQMLGYERAELLDRDPLSLVAADAREGVAERYAESISHATSGIEIHAQVTRKDGTVIDVGAQATASTFRGRPAVIGLAQDISEQKRSEDQIKRYLAQLETAFMRAVEVAMNLSEMRDPYTAGHERRVAEIAVAIGGELGLAPHRVEGLRVAGYLHDVGKISIPAELLSKSGRLSPAEFALVKEHATAGYEVLKNVEFPWPVAQVALQHHERMDGSGYPQRLAGDAILFEARVMAVADVVEAMTSHRPYRPGLGLERALAEIERGRDTLYDTAVADACLVLFREKGYVIPQ